MNERNPKTDHLLTSENSVLVLIDYQPGLIDGTKSISREKLINNVVALTKAAKMFDLPIILSTIAVASGYQKPTIDEIQSVISEVKAIDRKAVNAMEEEEFVKAIKQTNRKKIIIAGLWTEVCLAFPALDLLKQGYEVYAVSDASGGTSVDAHQRGMERVIQAGAVPVTWEAIMAELGRLYKGDYMNNFMDVMQQHLDKSA